MSSTPQYFKQLTGCLLVTVGAIGLPLRSAIAQSVIVPDDTLGAERSIVQPQIDVGLFDAIRGGATRGKALFHSFGQFNVADGLSAYFLVKPEIEAIFARVTGNNRSDILGYLGTRIDNTPLLPSTASLFLLNPNGIIFGPNAQLDLSGSFLATTASGIKLSDGLTFSAANPQAVPLLTVSVPVGLQFGANVGGIEVNGAKLFAGEGQTLALLGGDLQIAQDAFIIMQSGNINLSAIEKRESVGLQSLDGRWKFDYTSTSNFKNIVIDKSNVFSGKTGNAPAADIFLTSKNLTLQNDTSVAALLEANDSGGNIKILAAGDVLLHKTDAVGTKISTFNQSNGVARGGNISIEAGSLTIVDGASISTSILSGTGKAGSINLNLRGGLTIAGEYLSKRSFAQSSALESTFYSDEPGDAGNILVYAQDLKLDKGGRILLNNGGGKTPGLIDLQIRNGAVLTGGTTQGFASGIYNQRIDPTDRDEFVNSNSVVGIRVDAQSLLVENGAKISTSSAVDGSSRDIEINISDKLSVKGNQIISGSARKQYTVPSAIETQKSNGIGNAGKITLRVGTLEVLDGGSIGSDVSRLDFSSLGILKTSDGVFQGQSGTIDITAKERVIVDGYAAKPDSIGSFIDVYRISQINSGISAGAFAQGGNVSIQTKDLTVTNGGQILANTGAKGNAGDVSIAASGRVLVAGNSPEVDPSLYTVSRIASETRFAIQGDGGNINIIADLIELKNGGALRTANVNSVGDAGSLSLVARQDLKISGKSQNGNSSGIFSTVTSRSASVREELQKVFALVNTEQVVLTPEAIGNSGSITISAPVIKISDGGEISALNEAQGIAGSITANVSDRLILNNSNIQTRSDRTSGGAINLSAPVVLLRNDSNIKAQVGSGVGSGGSIEIQANSGIILLEDSDILAFAQDGRGGNITLNTPALLTRTYKPSDPTADLLTLDINGFVDINATGATSGIITLPDLNSLQNNRTELPQGLLDADKALSRSCLARNPNTGKFYITGAGGIPTQPGDPTLSNYSTLPVASASAEPTQIVEADGFYPLDNGKFVFGKACQTTEVPS
jgi:filamentous hemagglutinin family protein